jgi:hypothetical protein
MRKVKYAVCFMISALIAAFLHYTLPQHDIVRITGSYNRVTTVGSNKIFYANSDAGTAESTTTRDIRFIEAVRDNGNVIVYRNEDTGWIWPPYFKWDSSNVQAEASNLKSDKDAPIWVSITHYGWRMSWISIYPNAVSISAVAGPDVNITPWFNTIFFVFLAGLAIYIWRAWVRFRDNTLESALDELHGEIYRVGASGQATRQLLYLRWLAFKSTVRNALKRS